MKKVIIIAGLLLLIYTGYRIYYFANLHEGLQQVMEQGGVVLDVRTESEYSTGHIPGSINIPLSRLHAATLPLSRDARYVTVCSHGLRSVKAVTLLKEKGYTHVYNGGAWSDLERSLKRSK
ncbi:MAG: rhodanese-like domain-containing protein [Sphingobacteriales bacterium]|nr:MAG: rhodanese-like domain-containing protein [Sphingobacteriales bacterium]